MDITRFNELAGKLFLAERVDLPMFLAENSSFSECEYRKFFAELAKNIQGSRSEKGQIPIEARNLMAYELLCHQGNETLLNQKVVELDVRKENELYQLGWDLLLTQIEEKNLYFARKVGIAISESRAFCVRMLEFVSQDTSLDI